LGANLLGFLRSEKGLGEGARAVAKAMRAAGVPHVLNDLTDASSAGREGGDLSFETGNPHPVNIIHVNLPETVFWLRHPDYGERHIRQRFNVAFWNWELCDYPEDWRGGFEMWDEIWVPSLFALEAVAAVAPVPVRWVPYCVAADAPPRPDRRRFGLPDAAFVFLTAFDFQSVAERKNPAAAVEAFRRAFADRPGANADGGPRLLIKTVHADKRPEAAEALRHAAASVPGVTVFDGLLDREGMLSLLDSCDAFLALHRAEGFGFPIYEAMARGKPVVATDYSGNVDFMTSRNALPVRQSASVLAEDAGVYRRGSVWAGPDAAHAAELMRRLADDPGLAAAIGARGARDVARELSAERIGRLIRRRLEALLSRARPRFRNGEPMPEPPPQPPPAPPAPEPAPEPATVPAASAPPPAPAPGLGLNGRSDITAVELGSPRFLVGPLIGAAKRMAAGLVEPQLRRQVAFNEAVIQAVAEINHAALKDRIERDRALADVDAARARETAELFHAVAALRAEVAYGREQTEKLSAALAEAVDEARWTAGKLRTELRAVSSAVLGMMMMPGEASAELALPWAELPAGPVLDPWARSGRWLSAARLAGRPAEGAETDPVHVAAAAVAGLAVSPADGWEWLSSRPDGSAAAVITSRALGRMRPLELSELARLAAAKLLPGGRLALHSPAPAALSAAARAARLDFPASGIWPFDPEGVAHLLEEAGLREVRVGPVAAAGSPVPADLPDALPWVATAVRP
jgi:glycosyltransferase involved in cell wall biosynthesis